VKEARNYELDPAVLRVNDKVFCCKQFGDRQPLQMLTLREVKEVALLYSKPVWTSDDFAKVCSVVWTTENGCFPCKGFAAK